MADVELKVSGMTCGHCQMHVTEELEALDAVNSVNVDLQPGDLSTVKVAYEGELSDDALREAVDEAGGYVVESISRHA
ncbi:MAG: heavy-metal-associated domain-containing protein [Actinomycetaceae bacterium]|nr:heavy-metal-associated domain-containing protein [Arcanobacterium sp.]MDD7505667.1 heavy-metal-associated domain-containing protein [Actinomycetaceae bacterium]MDY6143452.1 heavy-metal-associated domain-containing protein [Arcanobacterium sp.]